jgi:hypothetical protein
MQSKDLMEIKLTFSCDELLPSCMSQAGRSIGADRLLYGVIEDKGSKLDVRLQLLDVQLGALERQVKETIDRKELQAGAVQQLATKLFNQIVPSNARPVLSVNSTPAGCTVEVDGSERGQTPLTLKDLSPGVHTVTVRGDGLAAQSRNVELLAGGTVDVAVKLLALGSAPRVAEIPKAPAKLSELGADRAAAPAAAPVRSSRTARIVGGVALGLAVASAVSALVTWRSYTDLEGHARDNLQKALDQGGVGGNAAFFVNPNCSMVPAGAAFDGVRADCSSGQAYANATTALWVVSGALAATGVIAILVGESQARSAPVDKRAQRPTLRIAPALSLQAAAVQAQLSF